MYDANVDGYVDASAVDLVGSDRILDANLLDVSGNGSGDTWLLDVNQNSVVDHIGFDRGEDGHVEEWHVDADENGAIEAVFLDQGGDGLPETMLLSGPSNPTVDIDWGARRVPDGSVLVHAVAPGVEQRWVRHPGGRREHRRRAGQPGGRRLAARRLLTHGSVGRPDSRPSHRVAARHPECG
jgi:hypothetical protein